MSAQEEDGRTPWWASEDPAGHEGEGGSEHGEHVRPAWLDAVQALDGAVRAAARSAKAAQERVADTKDGLAGQVDGVPSSDGSRDDSSRGAGGGGDNGGSGSGGDGRGRGGAGVPPGHEHGAIDAYCHICPVCALLRALEEVRPEVLVHLTEAARHLSLAAKAVVDAQVDRAGGTDDLEEIPFDD